MFHILNGSQSYKIYVIHEEANHYSASNMDQLLSNSDIKLLYRKRTNIQTQIFFNKKLEIYTQCLQRYEEKKEENCERDR